MDYILLDFGTFQAYQQIKDGEVLCYVDTVGNVLFTVPPVGNGGILVDANPPRESWML